MKEAIARSEALVFARRLLLLRAFLILAAAFSAVAGAVFGGIVYVVPELITTMLQLPPAAGTTAGDLLADFFTGAAFARVFEARDRTRAPAWRPAEARAGRSSAGRRRGERRWGRRQSRVR